MGGKRSWTPLGVLAWIVAGAAATFASEAAPPAEQTLGRIGVSRGICVVLADRPGERSWSLHGKASWSCSYRLPAAAAKALCIRPTGQACWARGSPSTTAPGRGFPWPTGWPTPRSSRVRRSPRVHRDDGEVRRVVRPLGKIVYPDRKW